MNTPYFVIHEEKLNILSKDLINSVQRYWPNFIIGYSFKTNANKWILNYMKSLGFYAEVVSNDEYEMAQYIGYGNKIIYNGVAKSKETYLSAIMNNSIVNIDSWREIRWLEYLPQNIKYKVGIRVNFDIEKMCPGQSSSGKDGGRFGFCLENAQLLKAIEAIKQYPNITIAGIHLHCSSKTRGIEIYKAIAKIACYCKQEYGLNLEYVDIGGGFFGGVPEKPTFDDYIREITSIFAKSFDACNTKIILEPGMSLVGASMSYVTSVVDVKKTEYNTFAVTDGSRMHIDPLMRKNNYIYHIKKMNKGYRQKLSKQVIVGYTCMENDRIFDLENVEEILEGDEITYEKVGAYTLCLAPQFIKRLPAIVVQNKGEEVCVEKPWTNNDLFRGDII